MSHESRANRADYADNEPLLNDSRQQVDDCETDKGEAVRILHGVHPIAEPSVAAGNESHVNSNAVDDSRSTTATVIDPNRNKTINMTIYYAWQLVCLLFISLTVYETYQNAQPNAHKYPVPTRFFRPDSYVIDYPRGDLSIIQNRVAVSDLTFVFFYAPWSAQSQRARPIYEAVAKHFRGEVRFVAINCWQPDGECRNEYKKVLAWPVLMAYTRHNTGVSYNGHWTQDSLLKFVYNMMRPIKRATNVGELLANFHRHDALAVLFVDMERNRTFYDMFYRTALKWLEQDPYGDVAFVVVTGMPAIETFDIYHSPTLRLYLWNETVEYEESTWKLKLLLEWTTTKLYKSSYWLNPPGSKSHEFHPFLQKGPILLLFTPRNLYEPTNDAYAMLRQISFEYGNCANNEWVSEMTRLYMFVQRQENILSANWLNDECEMEGGWELLAGSSKKLTFLETVYLGMFEGTCPAPNSSENICYDEQCWRNKQRTSSMPNDDADPRSFRNVRKAWRIYDCNMSYLAKRRQHMMFYDPDITTATGDEDYPYKKLVKLAGMACKTNKTLSFLAMDSYHYRLVAERLGVTLTKANLYTGMAIVNGQDETTHIMNKPITTSNVVEFIYDFSTKRVPRHLRAEEDVKHSYLFDSYAIHRDQYKYFHPYMNPNCSKRVTEHIRLDRIPAARFEEYIWQPNMTTVVLFTSTQCAFCKIFSSALLGVSRILKDSQFLKFGTIDVDRNDLPWQFTMDTVPTLIVFHGDNTLESRKYPPAMKITTANVLRFILSNLSHMDRITSFVHVLKYQRQERQLIEPTLIALRRATEMAIVENLRVWRQHPLKRTYTLKRIQLLRQLFLYIYWQPDRENCDLVELEELIKNIARGYVVDVAIVDINSKL